MKGNSNMAKSYLYLSQALGGEDGFDPTNPSVIRTMCGLLTELNKLLSTEYQLDINEYLLVGELHRIADCILFKTQKRFLPPIIGGSIKKTMKMCFAPNAIFRDIMTSHIEVEGNGGQPPFSSSSHTNL